MPNNNEKIAKDKLEFAFDNFALLKSTLNNFQMKNYYQCPVLYVTILKMTLA